MANVHERNIAELLEAKITESSEFSRTNFGLELGSDFPEIARELLANRRIATKLMVGYIMTAMGSAEVAQRITPGEEAETIVSQNPAMYRQPLSFLYWGTQVGRELERREVAALKAMEQGS